MDRDLLVAFDEIAKLNRRLDELQRQLTAQGDELRSKLRLAQGPQGLKGDRGDPGRPGRDGSNGESGATVIREVKISG